MTSTGQKESGEASTYAATSSCLDNFQLCLKYVQKQDLSHMRIQLGDFKLWVDSVGAAAKGEAALDRRFRTRPKDIRFISELLRMLSRLLHNCSEAARTRADLHNVFVDIDSTLDSLAFIGVQARLSGRTSRLRRAENTFARKRDDYTDLRAHLACMITTRPCKDEGYTLKSADYFSSLALSELQERLVEANLRRRHRFIEAQRHSLDLEGAPWSDIRVDVTPRSVAKVAEDVQKNKQSSPVEVTTRVVSTPHGQERKVPGTSASTVDSKFPALTTARKVGSAVTRITKITAAADYPKANLPTKRVGLLFKCPCCCQAIPISDLNDTQWRKHLAYDLCPYTCFLPKCPTPFSLFLTQKEWHEHVLLDHAPLWQCPLCKGHQIRYQRLSEFTLHAMTQHEVTAEALEELIPRAEVHVTGITGCPLYESEGPEDDPDLIQHVLQHVHDFSLRSLPWASDPVIRLGNEVGTFDMTYAFRVIQDNEGGEDTYSVADWAAKRDPSSGLGDGFSDYSDAGNSYIANDGSGTIPTLQLCDFDLHPPQIDLLDSLARAHVDDEYFTRHQYFRDASSDGRIDSQDYDISQNSRNGLLSLANNLPKHWSCSLCALEHGRGDDTFLDHLDQQHEEDEGRRGKSDEEIDQWRGDMLAVAYWNGLEEIPAPVVVHEPLNTSQAQIESPSAEHAFSPLAFSTETDRKWSGRASTANEPSIPEQVQSTSTSVEHPVESLPGGPTNINGSPGSYIFRVDEFTEHPQAPEQYSNDGRWVPTTIKGYNIRVAGGASGLWWYCDRKSIYPLPSPPQGSTPYKTISTVFGGGHGFFILRGDATNPMAGENWQYLTFDWDETTYSSSLSAAGVGRTLRVQDNARRWPHMLLPDVYHGAHYSHAGYGGLTGELAILIALIAFSMRPERLETQLPLMMRNGEWKEHSHPHGRTDKRGVIVYVYACNGDDDELRALEEGNYGMYYH